MHSLTEIDTRFIDVKTTGEGGHPDLPGYLPRIIKLEDPGSVGLEAQEIYNPFLTPFPDTQRFCLRDRWQLLCFIGKEPWLLPAKSSLKRCHTAQYSASAWVD